MALISVCRVYIRECINLKEISRCSISPLKSPFKDLHVASVEQHDINTIYPILPEKRSVRSATRGLKQVAQTILVQRSVFSEQCWIYVGEVSLKSWGILMFMQIIWLAPEPVAVRHRSKGMLRVSEECYQF